MATSRTSEPRAATVPSARRHDQANDHDRVTKPSLLRTDHITDDYMLNRLSQAKAYALVVLKPTPEYFAAGARTIIWEHGRRNMALQAAGIMPIVCPVGDDEISGISIFNTDPDEARTIMADDPGVRAGIFTVEVHTCRGFPGDALPS